MALEWRLDPLPGHQLVERFDRSPPTGVDPHRGDAQEGCQLDLLKRLLDLGSPQAIVRAHEALMRREAHQGQAERMGPPLDSADRGARLVLHLEVEDLDAVEAHRGRLVDTGLDAGPIAPKLPKGVSRRAPPP